MNFDKDLVANLFSKIEAIAKDPVNHNNEDYLDPDTENIKKLAYTLCHSLTDIDELRRQLLAIVMPGASADMDDPNDYKVMRRPVFVSDNTALLITVFEASNSMTHLFLHDYVDYRKEQSVAAADFIAQISDMCSVNFLWSLKEAINNEITKHNKECGTNHPLNRPEGD